MTVDAATSPGRTIELHLSAAQVAYLRELLFEDLTHWPEALAEQAHGAYEKGACHPVESIDAMNTFGRNVTTDLLDVIGWDVTGDGDAIRWLTDLASDVSIRLEC